MSIYYCNLCQRNIEPKRKIGAGTLILCFMTSFFWVLVIPFYEKRCPICFCGHESYVRVGKPTTTMLRLFLVGVFLLLCVFRVAPALVDWAASRSASTAERQQEPISTTDAVLRSVPTPASAAVPAPQAIEITLPEQQQQPASEQAVVAAPPVDIQAMAALAPSHAPAIPVSDLIIAYVRNEGVADERYKDKTMRFTGIAQVIDRNAETPFLVLGPGIDGRQWGALYAHFSEEEAPRLARVTPGDRVEVECTVNGKVPGAIVASDCVLHKGWF